MRIAIVGGSLTGNKGAASMVLGLLDALPGTEAIVLSPSAATDASSPDAGTAVPLLPFGPVEILTTCLAALGHRLTHGRLSTRQTRALAQADVVADVSGISFVDGRGLVTLAYNVLLLVPALVLGTPTVKVAQAMGPFHGPTLWTARAVLPRLTTVLARGSGTAANLETAGLPHDGIVPDSAFLMAVHDEDDAWAGARVEGLRDPVAVVPSQVVVGQATDDGAQYRRAVLAVIDDLSERHDVLVIAHSARPGEPASRLNDIPLCEELVRAARRPDRCHLVIDGSPRELRALMGRCRAVVASRFHAMVSCLATSTPVFVIGWSHKYAEVLQQFGCAELAIDHTAVRGEALLQPLRDLVADAPARRAALAARLPEVREAAERNATAVRSAAEG